MCAFAIDGCWFFVKIESALRIMVTFVVYWVFAFFNNIDIFAIFNLVCTSDSCRRCLFKDVVATIITRNSYITLRIALAPTIPRACSLSIALVVSWTPVWSKRIQSFIPKTVFSRTCYSFVVFALLDFVVDVSVLFKMCTGVNRCRWTFIKFHLTRYRISDARNIRCLNLTSSNNILICSVFFKMGTSVQICGRSLVKIELTIRVFFTFIFWSLFAILNFLFITDKVNLMCTYSWITTW